MFCTKRFGRLEFWIYRMNEYKTDINHFYRRTRQRVITESLIYGSLWCVYAFEWMPYIPDWAYMSIFTVFGAYIMYGIIYYPKAKAIAQRFSIKISDRALVFSDFSGVRQIPYSDFEINKIDKCKDRVCRIHIKTSFNQSIVLQGLENMDTLYQELSEHVTRINVG